MMTENIKGFANTLKGEMKRRETKEERADYLMFNLFEPIEWYFLQGLPLGFKNRQTVQSLQDAFNNIKVAKALKYLYKQDPTAVPTITCILLADVVTKLASKLSIEAAKATEKDEEFEMSDEDEEIITVYSDLVEKLSKRGRKALEEVGIPKRVAQDISITLPVSLIVEEQRDLVQVRHYTRSVLTTIQKHFAHHVESEQIDVAGYMAIMKKLFGYTKESYYYAMGQFIAFTVNETIHKVNEKPSEQLKALVFTCSEYMNDSKKKALAFTAAAIKEYVLYLAPANPTEEQAKRVENFNTALDLMVRGFGEDGEKFLKVYAKTPEPKRPNKKHDNKNKHNQQHNQQRKHNNGGRRNNNNRNRNNHR